MKRATFSFLQPVMYLQSVQLVRSLWHSHCTMNFRTNSMLFKIWYDWKIVQCRSLQSSGVWSHIKSESVESTKRILPRRTRFSSGDMSIVSKWSSALMCSGNGPKSSTSKSVWIASWKVNTTASEARGNVMDQTPKIDKIWMLRAWKFSSPSASLGHILISATAARSASGHSETFNLNSLGIGWAMWFRTHTDTQTPSQNSWAKLTRALHISYQSESVYYYCLRIWVNMLNKKICRAIMWSLKFKSGGLFFSTEVVGEGAQPLDLDVLCQAQDRCWQPAKTELEHELNEWIELQQLNWMKTLASLRVGLCALSASCKRNWQCVLVWCCMIECHGLRLE